MPRNGRQKLTGDQIIKLARLRAYEGLSSHDKLEMARLDVNAARLEVDYLKYDGLDAGQKLEMARIEAGIALLT